MAISQKGILKKTNKYNCLSPNHLDYLGEYRVWQHILERCYNPKCDMFYAYGGRGITVYRRWADRERGFINFYYDMGKRPVDTQGRNYQIDRIDVDGSYCPENCRWVSVVVNARNRRGAHNVFLWGDEMSVADAARCLNVARTTIAERARLRRVSIEDAVLNALRVKYGDRLCVL